MKYQWFLDNQIAIVVVSDGAILFLLYIKMLFILCKCMECLRERKQLYTFSLHQVCWNYALNGRRQNSDFGNGVSDEPVSYSDLILLVSALCTLPVSTNPHL